MARIYFWYRICPNCNQGRLFIFKNVNANKLYLHCEECETGYYDPSHLDKEHSFLTLNEDFESVIATMDDVKMYGWGQLQIEMVIE